MKYKRMCIYIFVYILMILIGFTGLYITALIPKAAIEENIKESANILSEEGAQFLYSINGRKIRIDNYTDAIMLNTIYSIDNNNILESIIKCRRNYIPNITTNCNGEKTKNLNNDDGTYDTVQDLVDVIDGKDFNSYEYARYWHGYMTILRPMLLIFNITQIRIIFLILLCLSLLVLSLYLWKEKNVFIAVLTVLSFFALDLMAFSKNLHGIFVMNIAIITSIFIVNKKIKKENINFVLFIVGGITAYLDFLSTPLITILLPAIIYFSMEREYIKESLKKFFVMCLFWGIGYFGVWFSKWVINDCIYNSNLILMALNQIVFRINSNDGVSNLPLKSLEYNIENAFNMIIVIILIISVINIIKNKTNFQKYKLIYCIIGIVPILWYLIISNHSCMHYFFTYRLLVVTGLSIVFIAFDNEENKKTFSKITYRLNIIIIILCLIFYILTCIKSFKNNRFIDPNNDIFVESDEKIEEESQIYDELMAKDYANQNYKEPYILDGFSYVEGTWNTGYVVQDENQNQYVWVPCSNKNISEVVNLNRYNQSASPFINYTSCYNENYEEFIESALENGGFYISRYEIGKQDNKPVSKFGVEVWTDITKQEAENIISNMYENVNCEIINGYAYDTTIAWIKETSNVQIENKEIELGENNLLISGRNINNNIYDLYDNILEYSQEVLYDTIVVRGYINSNSTEYTNGIVSKENRYCILSEEKKLGQDIPIVIRTVLYK